jgi:hypothetical protein
MQQHKKNFFAAEFIGNALGDSSIFYLIFFQHAILLATTFNLIGAVAALAMNSLYFILNAFDLPLNFLMCSAVRRICASLTVPAHYSSLVSCCFNKMNFSR